MENNNIEDDKLIALIAAFLGKIHDSKGNTKEAIPYLQTAVEAEKRLGNVRNQVIDYCSLLISLVKTGDERSHQICQEMDSVVSIHPEFYSNNVDNAKAVYYFNARHQMDSALHYCQRWNPAPIDIGAKQNMMAGIYRQKGQLDSAIFWEKSSYAHARPSDSLYRHIYYRHLANDYDQLGNADSAAHYP